MPSIGPLELAIILVIVLVIFGPKRLPGLGRQLGSGMREFKDSLTKIDRDRDEIEDEDEDDARDDARRRRELHEAPAHEPHGTPAREPHGTPAREPEVVTGEARPEDQPASRTDS